MKRLFLVVSLLFLSACSQKMPTATVSSIEETQPLPYLFMVTQGDLPHLGT
jgi:uncharacterized lipoprotein YmbA